MKLEDLEKRYFKDKNNCIVSVNGLYPEHFLEYIASLVPEPKKPKLKVGDFVVSIMNNAVWNMEYISNDAELEYYDSLKLLFSIYYYTIDLDNHKPPTSYAECLEIGVEVE